MLDDFSSIHGGQSFINRSMVSLQRGTYSASNKKNVDTSRLSKSRASRQGSHHSRHGSPGVSRRASAHHSSIAMLPKSQEYLVKVFCQEFWPITQGVLQKKSNEDLVRMLESHDLKTCAEKENADAFLFL